MGWNRMKLKYIILIILILIIPQSVLALDCQYTDMEPYKENHFSLVYKDTLKFASEPLELTYESNNTYLVKNPFDFELHVYFTYDVVGAISEKREYGIKIEPNSYGKINELCIVNDQMGSCNIVNSSIDYWVIKPKPMILKNITFDEVREVCKKCGEKNGKLNDAMVHGNRGIADDYQPVRDFTPGRRHGP